MEDIEHLYRSNKKTKFKINPNGKEIRGIKPIKKRHHQQYDFENAIDFLDALDIGKSELFQTQVNEPYTKYLYRGHKYDYWKLIPSAYRVDPNDKSKLNKVEVYKSGNGPTQYKEIENFVNFVKGLDTLGLNTTDASYNFMKDQLDSDLLFGLNPNYMDSFYFPKPSFFPELALAQHYGVKTRLLDFTTNPMTATFFASENAFPYSEYNRDKVDKIGIWIIPKALIWLASQEKTYIRYIDVKKFQNKYISAQNGVFLNYFPSVSDHSKFVENILDITISLDKHLWSNYKNKRIKEIKDEIIGKPMLFTLPHSELMPIASKLNQLNLNWTSLMPSLDGVKKEVNRLEKKPFDNKI